MDANKTQVGGNHYRTNFQHWDWVGLIRLPYLPAQVTKYLTRWRKKNGLQDLQKALHFLEKYIEEEHQAHEDLLTLTQNYLKENGLDKEEKQVVMMLVNYILGDGDRLVMAQGALRRLVAEAERIPPNGL